MEFLLHFCIIFFLDTIWRISIKMMVGFVLKKTFYSFGDLRKARSCTIEGHIRSRSHEVHQEVTEKDYNFKSKVMF